MARAEGVKSPPLSPNMARERIIYRKDKSGNTIKIPANQVARHDPNESMEDFDTRMRKTLYQLECEKGSRFNVPGYSKNLLKAVWFDNKAA